MLIGKLFRFHFQQAVSSQGNTRQGLMKTRKYTQTWWQNKLHLRLQHRRKTHPLTSLPVFLKNEKHFLNWEWKSQKDFKGGVARLRLTNLKIWLSGLLVCLFCSCCCYYFGNQYEAARNKNQSSALRKKQKELTSKNTLKKKVSSCLPKMFQGICVLQTQSLFCLSEKGFLS